MNKFEENKIINDLDHPESNCLKKYTLLLFFVLRQVVYEDTLIDIIENQFQDLTFLDICQVQKYLENYRDQICLLFDGFDELKLKHKKRPKFIDVIAGNDKQDVLCIITSRSQGISELTRYNPKVIQSHVKLCGFDKKLIERYILYYFKRDETCKSAMVENIKEGNLWKLASIPIRLQMMCFVWKIYGKLGQNMAELYSMLIKGLTRHMEERHGTELTPGEDIKDTYHRSILLPTAKLANRWDEHGNLDILFSLSDIQKETGENYKQVLDFGCVTKYFPSSQMEQTLWNFTHLSLQEYFVAFDIAHTDRGSSEFGNKCLNVRALEKYRLILEVLCSLAPEKANEFITAVVKADHKLPEYLQLWDHLLRFVDSYKDVSEVDIPLPRQVTLDGDDKIEYLTKQKKLMYIAHLLKQDYDKHRNMSVLRVFRLDELPDEFNTEHIKGLYLTIDKNEQFKKADKLLSSLSDEAQVLTVVFSDAALNKERLVHNIKTDKISTFSIEGPGVISLAASIIKKQPNLRVLNVHDTNQERLDRSSYIKRMCEEANKGKNLEELVLTGNVVDKSLTALSKNIKLTIRSKQAVEFSENIVSSRARIVEVDLSGFTANNPENLISRILINLETLQILKLERCGITSYMMFQMDKILQLAKKNLPLQELDMLGNNLNCFSDMHYITDHCPDLKKILMTCTEDSNLPTKLGKTETVVATGTKFNPTRLYFNESMYNLEKLYTIYVTPDIPEIPTHYQLELLCILDVPEPVQTIKTLSKTVKYMNKLKELHFSTNKPQMIEPLETVWDLIRNLPPRLRHLNLNGYFADEMIQILELKHILKKLHKLNIGPAENDPYVIQIIRQEIQQLNTSIDVYCDPEEASLSLVSCDTDMDWSLKHTERDLFQAIN